MALLAGRTVFIGRKGRVAGVGGVAALGACLLLSACGSVQMGAAAIVGNQRITQATLDSQVSNFEEAAANYPGQVQVTSADAPAAVLSWLIRFSIENRMASNAGISVSQTEVQAGVQSVSQQIAEEQEEEGQSASLTPGLLNAGVPPQMLSDLGRYQAQLDAFAAKANGGKLPSTTAQNNAVTTAVTKAQCTAAKSLNIRVNPQYGVFNYTEYAVESGSTSNTLSAPAGQADKALDVWPHARVLTLLLSSSRVAPGLLSWAAWSALRDASRVLAGSAEHPLIPVLAEAGVSSEVVDLPGAEDGVRAPLLAAFLTAAVADAAGPVVWLLPPGAGEPAALLDSLSASGTPVRVVRGARDLPGAHLLDVVAIMDKLRVSCPWDREQTHESLLKYLLEETYEAAEAIETSDWRSLREELGDVLFQAVFHARVAAERAPAEGGFTIDDVADELAAKLVRRHPHVFASVAVSSADEVNQNWEEIKKAEKAKRARESGSGPASVLDGVAFGQPALSLAAQLQRRAARAGAPGVPGADGVAAGGAPDADGIGDELMRVVARARETGVDPELALREAARRYAERVHEWERSAG